MFKTRKYKPADLINIATTLRPSDCEYINKMTNSRPYLALSVSFAEADELTTVLNEDDKPVAVFAHKKGNVWLQTTSLTDGRAKDVIRVGKKLVAALGDAELYCVVPSYDKRVLLLCRAMGFTERTNTSSNFMGSGLPHIELTRRAI